MLAVGAPVRRRGSDDVGVIVSGASSGWRVAFGSSVMLLHADDLKVAPGSPAEQLAAGLLAPPEDHLLRVQAHYLQHAYRHDPLASLNNARIEPQMHQVFVAHRVARKLRPRMILADEVGLGKTIEAGLIIKELRAREQIERVLIVAPASLTRQWQSELASKFNESFDLIDGVAAAHLGKNGANPFLAQPNAICSLPFATSKKRFEQVLEGEWDLVVFDEAHRVRRTKQKETEAYKLADELKEEVNGLLLLTATPVQLHQYELYSLVQLVEPGLFRNEAAFESQRQHVPELNRLMQVLEGWETLPAAQRSSSFAEHRARLSRSGCTTAADLDDDERRAQVAEQVIAQHPLADVMVRNRKAELGLAGRRQARTERVALNELEIELYDDVTAYIRDGYDRAKASGNAAVGFLMVTHQKMLASSSHALRTSFRRRIAALEGKRKSVHAQARLKQVLDVDFEDPLEASTLSEKLEQADVAAATYDLEIRELTSLAERLDDVRDSKMARAVALVNEILSAEPDAKIVVFTQFIETQNFFAKVLVSHGVGTVTFNGELNAEAKERAIREFRERASVLVSTEAGGEGRNLQFARHLVNYDLPWNPMKVEQRIGRLDRIGQRNTVHIYNLVAEGTLEERILDVLNDRIRLFEESVGALDPILGSLEKDIERLALATSASQGEAAFNLFSQDLDVRLLQARAVEKRLADFVLDRASFRRDQLNELTERPALASQSDVAAFCQRALDHFGGFLAEHEEGGDTVRLSPRAASRLGLPRQGYHGVFSAEEALRRDELDFFAFGHDLVDSLVRTAAAGDGAEVGGRRRRSLPEGEWIEVVYEVRSSVGHKRGSLVQHLVGPDLVPRSAELREVPMDEPAVVRPPDWTAEALQASQDRFDREFFDLRAGYIDEYNLVQQQLRERERRLYDYRRDRLELAVAQAQEWLDEHDHSNASAKERKVIPARRGKLNKDLERLTLLKERHELELERILAEKPDIAGSIAWASVVVGG